MSGLPAELPFGLPGGSSSCEEYASWGGLPASLPLELPGGPEAPTELTYGVCADAEDNLLGQYQDSPRLKDLLCSYLCRLQNLDTETALLYQRALSIEDAWGGHLDRLGKIIREGRNGRGDDDYRRILRAAIRASRSRGATEDYLEILRLLESTSVARVRRSGDATLEVLVSAPTEYPVPTDDVFRLLNRARAAGVRLHGSLPVTAGAGFRLGRASAYPEGSTTDGLSWGDSPVTVPGGALGHAF